MERLTDKIFSLFALVITSLLAWFGSMVMANNEQTIKNTVIMTKILEGVESLELYKKIVIENQTKLGFLINKER